MEIEREQSPSLEALKVIFFSYFTRGRLARNQGHLEMLSVCESKWGGGI